MIYIFYLFNRSPIIIMDETHIRYIHICGKSYYSFTIKILENNDKRIELLLIIKEIDLKIKLGIHKLTNELFGSIKFGNSFQYIDSITARTSEFNNFLMYKSGDFMYIRLDNNDLIYIPYEPLYNNGFEIHNDRLHYDMLYSTRLYDEPPTPPMH